MAAPRFSIDDGVPTWVGDYWRVWRDWNEVVIADDLRGYGSIPAAVAEVTMRQIVDDILSEAPTRDYDHELVELVRAAAAFDGRAAR